MRTSHIFSAVGSRQSRWQSDGEQNEKAEQKKKKGGGGPGTVSAPPPKQTEQEPLASVATMGRAYLLRWVPGRWRRPLPKPLQTEWV